MEKRNFYYVCIPAILICSGVLSERFAYLLTVNGYHFLHASY